MSFLDSIVAGVGVFAFWETYVAALEYAAVWMLPAIIFYTIGERSGDSVATGCLGMVVLAILQIIAIFIFVVTMGPIVLGLSDDAAWASPWRIMISTPSVFLKVVGILCVTNLVLSMAPFIGRLDSLHTLILSALVLILMIESVGANEELHYFPSFGFTAGILVVGGIASFVGAVVSALISGVFDEGEDLGILTVQLTSGLFGFIPTFIYGSWLGAQIL